MPEACKNTSYILILNNFHSVKVKTLKNVSHFTINLSFFNSSIHSFFIPTSALLRSDLFYLPTAPIFREAAFSIHFTMNLKTLVFVG